MQYIDIGLHLILSLRISFNNREETGSKKYFKPVLFQCFVRIESMRDRMQNAPDSFSTISPQLGLSALPPITRRHRGSALASIITIIFLLFLLVRPSMM